MKAPLLQEMERWRAWEGFGLGEWEDLNGQKVRLVPLRVVGKLVEGEQCHLLGEVK